VTHQTSSGDMLYGFCFTQVLKMQNYILYLQK